MLISITNTCKCYSPGGTSSVEVSAVTEKNIGHVDQFDTIMLASSANNPPPPPPHTHTTIPGWDKTSLDLLFYLGVVNNSYAFSIRLIK